MFLEYFFMRRWNCSLPTHLTIFAFSYFEKTSDCVAWLMLFIINNNNKVFMLLDSDVVTNVRMNHSLPVIVAFLMLMKPVLEYVEIWTWALSDWEVMAVRRLWGEVSARGSMLLWAIKMMFCALHAQRLDVWGALLLDRGLCWFYLFI